MLITINILSAISIVMGLFIPYFILLHLNNKLRKEVEGALNRVLEVKQYSEITRKKLIEFAESSNHNFEGQDKNWEKYNETIKLTQEGISLFNKNFEGIDKNFKSTNETFDHIINAIENLHELVNQKQQHDEVKHLLKKVSEIDRTLNKVIQRQLQAKNLKEILENPIEVKKEACETKMKLKEEVNEPKPKRKYTKRTIKNEN